MRHRIPLDKNLTDEQLKQMVGQFLDRMVEKMGLSPLDKEKVLSRKDEIVESLVQGMKREHGEISLSDLNKPEFLNKFFMNLISTIMTAKNMGEKLSFSKEFGGLKPSELQALKADFDKTKEDIASELNKVRKEPRPEPKPKAEQAQKDPNTEMLGLVNTFITGGLAAVIPAFLGNRNAYPDQNPEHGNAQIDLINKTDDTEYGDPMGLNFEAIANFMSQGGLDESLAEEMQASIYASPSLTPNQGNQ